MKMGVLVLSSLLCVSQITQSVLYADAKNSNVEDIGNRDINKGNWNFTSLEKEIALGRSLATEIEKQGEACQRSGDHGIRQPSRSEHC